MSRIKKIVRQVKLSAEGKRIWEAKMSEPLVARIVEASEGKKQTDIFHVHSYRCGHAENVPDEAYVKKAIELGASGIWFADHAPFPGNPFGNRMQMDELQEYLDTLSDLKKKYEDSIEIKAGLEIEFFPSFCAYYATLKDKQGLDFLLLGQHMYEITPGEYSFSLAPEQKNQEEYHGLGEAIIEGLNTGLFDVLAHPDRIFRRRKKEPWNEGFEAMSRAIIKTAVCNGVILERNIESMQRKYCYKKEFWDMVPEEAKTVYGLDAHSLEDLEEKWKIQKTLLAEQYSGGEQFTFEEAEELFRERR